jgi:hypothetical protein
MGNRHLYKIECLHTLGTTEFERLKVTALNLFHPTVSPPFSKSQLIYFVTHRSPFDRLRVSGSLETAFISVAVGHLFFDRPAQGYDTS